MCSLTTCTKRPKALWWWNSGAFCQQGLLDELVGYGIVLDGMIAADGRLGEPPVRI